jgi:hypothetical protein
VSVIGPPLPALGANTPPKSSPPRSLLIVETIVRRRRRLLPTLIDRDQRRMDWRRDVP